MANCDFQPTDESGTYQCVRCAVAVRNVQALPILRQCRPTGEPVIVVTIHGPGTELSRLLAEIGFGRHCETCSEHMRAMNAWGIAGCREHLEEITAWLRESYERLGWAEKLKAAASALGSGLALKIDPRDPARSLMEIAIRRAAGTHRS